MLSAVNITDLEIKTRAGCSCVSPICEVVVTLDNITHPQQITFTITDRESEEVNLARLQGYDHIGIQTDDFDATMARIEELGVEIWDGPKDGGGFRIVFVNGPDNAKIELMETA